MKIVLIHGDNTDKAYARYSQIVDSVKARNWEVVRHSPETSKLSDTLQAQSLFGGERMILIENLGKVKKSEWKWLRDSHKSFEGNVLLYHTGSVTAAFLKELPKELSKEEFAFPKLIWSFLDAFYPRNNRIVLKLFHELIKTEAPELVFTLLSSRLRDLAWIALGNGPNYPSWRISKLKGQLKRWQSNSLVSSHPERSVSAAEGSFTAYSKLLTVIQNLAEIDLKVKSSNANLTDSLDFLIVKELE